jgi:hypothetical protein
MKASLIRNFSLIDTLDKEIVMKVCTHSSTQTMKPARGSIGTNLFPKNAYQRGLSATNYEDICNIIDGDFVPAPIGAFDYSQGARDHIQSLLND